MKNIKTTLSAGCLACFSLLVNAECTDQRFEIYKRYDEYLEKNPSVSTAQARVNVAPKVKMSPDKLKDLYFECIPRGAAAAKELRAATAEDAKTLGIDCKTLGSRYAQTARNTMKGLPVNPNWDFVKPARCNGSKEFDVGLSLVALAK